MSVKDVCSGCASWVEQGWSYCMHCGAARPVTRSSLTSASLYSNSGTTVASKEKRNLRRRRRPSEEVGRQLQQWRRKSQVQEGLLQELQRCNATTQRAVAAKTESDLRRVVQDGRTLVRNWPLTSAPSSMLKMTGRGRKIKRRSSSEVPVSTNAADTTGGRSSRKENWVAGNEVDHWGCSLTGAHAVDATLTGEEDKLHGHRQISGQSLVDSIDSQAQVEENFQANIPLQERALPQRARKSVRGRSSNNSETVISRRQQSSGWYWGAGGSGPGGGGNDDSCDIDIAAPGEGTMAAYWREPSAATGRPSVGDTAFAARFTAVTSAADNTLAPQSSSSSRQASFGNAAAKENFSFNDKHSLVEEISKTKGSSHNRLFISVASAKAAVRSASNRAAELSHLLREGNNPPREECLAKAESAVRAAASAISCANERLFQLELMVAAEPAAQEGDGEIDGAEGAPAGNEKQLSSSTTSSVYSSPSLSTHIKELTEQLKLAQTLQAVSVTARARLSRRFALEAIAAVRLQALVRGCVARWRERRKEAAVTNIENKAIALKQQGEGNMGSQQANTEVGILPRTEELWWTPAQVESADVIGESESVLVKAVVKLQAIVRSRLARSQTIAAVNARFVEHFDNEHQHPFYVCIETNTSQWTMPFGFGFAPEGRARVFSSRLVRGVSTTKPLQGKVDSSRACSSLAENTEETGEMESFPLKAVIKLQAIIRSRIERSRTFAAVNARFVEHFDEGYQHPFYVCTETNSSQWNQPFGFGCERGGERRAADAGAPYTLEGAEGYTSCPTAAKDEGVATDGCGRTTDGGAGGQILLCGTLDEQEAAVTAIQCAVRSARARAQLAEKIVLASL